MRATEVHGVGNTQDWRARKRDDTHRRIHDTALRLFQEHGFEAVSVGQIAAGAGVSVPTFYAHYPSKEHLVMHLPSGHDFALMLAGQSPDLPLTERIRRAVPLWLSQWTPEFRADALARWRVVAATPSLRTRAAEFERATGGVLADALPTPPGMRPADAIIVNAYMAAYTAALLAWADGNGERTLEEIVEEAFDALQHP
jgi:AcrR family transcriptional regulator